MEWQHTALIHSLLRSFSRTVRIDSNREMIGRSRSISGYREWEEPSFHCPNIDWRWLVNLAYRILEHYPARYRSPRGNRRWWTSFEGRSFDSSYRTQCAEAVARPRVLYDYCKRRIPYPSLSPCIGSGSTVEPSWCREKKGQEEERFSHLEM